MTGKRIAKAAAFLALVAATVVVCSSLFLPSFRDTAGNNDETVRGLYHQPQNSIQVAFLGTSTVLSGIQPMALYEDYGIASYNCGTRAQPFIISYYLLKDLQRRNPDSLTTVVLDPSYIFHTSTDMSRAEETVNYMEDSPVKLEAMQACAEYYEGFDLAEHLVPVLRYHSRWNELGPFDFEKLAKGDSALDFSRHGYFARFSSNMDYEGNIITTEQNEEITEEITHEDEELEGTYDRGKEYLDKIVGFCKDNGLDLVFLKIPKAKWDSLSHDAMKKVADEYGVPFVDMDLTEIFKEIDLSYDHDYSDNRHPNVNGASKITAFVGDYLKEHYDLADVRGDAAHAFMEGDLERYHNDIEDAQLLTCDDFEEYLRMLARDRYTVFISVRGEAFDGLSDGARRYLGEELGLEVLSQLGTDDHYVGIMRGGQKVHEKVPDGGRTAVRLVRAFDGEELTMRTTKLQPGAGLENEIMLYSSGSQSSIVSSMFGDFELSENKHGLNFVVFDHETGDLIDSSSFDTHSPECKRTSDRTESQIDE